jgi:pyruvate,water dikinase
VTSGLVDWDYWLNTWPDSPLACTRANAADGYPRPLTPISQDLVLTYEELGVRRFYCETMGVLPAGQVEAPFMTAFYGYVYLNADHMGTLGEVTPGSSRQAMYQQFFGLDPDPEYRPPSRSLRERAAEALTGLQVAPRMHRLGKRVTHDIEEQSARVRAARPGGDLAALGDAELAAWLSRLDAIQVEAWHSLMTGSVIAGALFEIVRKLLAAWAGDTKGDLTNRLHVGLGGNESAESGRAVRHLAEVIAAAGAAPCLDEPDPEAALRAHAPQLGAELDGFLRRFGHRGPAEMELANPSFRADPRLVLDVVRAEIERPDPGDDGGAGVRPAAEAELTRRLGRRRRLVDPFLRRSQQQMSLRENGKIPIVRLWDEIRMLLAAAGPRLADRGVLPSADRVFYLRHSELHAVLTGHPGPGVAEIERRHRELERCNTLSLPELVEAGPGFLRPLDTSFIRDRGLLPPPPVEAGAAVLSGIAAAPGEMTGTARVLTDPDGEFEPGDVLFARTVDPGWAPVLACAGAVVLDIGGVLSHGAMVARELGIPCVVNVKVGTERAVSGTKVTVDGSAGEVRFEEG